MVFAGRDRLGLWMASSVRDREGREEYLRESVHEGICEIPISKEEIVLQCQEVIK